METIQNLKLDSHTLFSVLRHANEQGISLTAVIVLKAEAFKQEYSVESRSYRFSNQCNFFDHTKISSSLWASCLDGTDPLIRLDWYLDNWPIEYGYILPNTPTEE